MKLYSNAIPGIHNYCDRWCERCHFTSRCNVFENPADLNPEELDIRNKAFWDRMAKQFSETIELLHKAAAEMGVDLSVIPTNEIRNAEREQIHRQSKKHKLAELSLDYSTAAMNWLKTTGDLNTKQNELVEHLTLGILPEAKAKDQVASIKDCLDIIQWYVHFIHVKFMRAITGKLEDDGWAKENGFQNDYDGSAKIALIAVERSVQAWSALRSLLTLDEDVFLKMAGTLQKIKVMAEKEFPKAYQFIRPGFDEQ